MNTLVKYLLRLSGTRNGIYYADSHMEVDSEGIWIKAADFHALLDDPQRLAAYLIERQKETR